MPQWLISSISINNWILPFTILDFFLKFALPAFFSWLTYILLHLLIRRVLNRFIKNEETRAGIKQKVKIIFRMLLYLLLLLFLASLIGDNLFSIILHQAYRFLITPFISSNNSQISLMTILWVLLIFFSSSLMGRIINARVKDSYLHRFGLSDEQSFTVRRLARYAIITLFFLVGLSVVGINLSALGVIFGVLGVGIGFGLQSLVGDLVAGISLISMGLIKEGDLIRIDGYNGSIQRIRLINTELITFENEALIIPNHRFTTNIIHNQSYKDKRLVIVNAVDVSYNSDLDEVIKILSGIATRNPWLDKSQGFLVRVVAFADSGISMQLRTWIGDISNWGNARSWTNLEIWRSFARNNIEIPFPQRVVHMPGKSTESTESTESPEPP